MKIHRTPEQWQTLINQHRNSGLSIKQFCQQHKLACSCFYTWRKRLAEQATPTQEPYQSMATKPSASQKTNFLDLSALVDKSTSANQGWDIDLSLGKGVELRLSQNP